MCYKTLTISIIGSTNILLLLLVAAKSFSYYKQNPLGLRNFFYVVLTAAVYSVFFMGAYWATDTSCLNLFLQGMLAGQMSISTICLFFFLAMADTQSKLLKRIQQGMLLFLALHVAICFTNQYHHLLYTNAAKDLSDLTYSFTPGPWLILSRYYSLSVILVNGAVILLALMGKNKKTFSITLSIFLAFVITSILSIFHNEGILDLPFNPMGFMLSFAACLTYYCCFEYLGEVRTKAIDFTEDCYFVFDFKGDLIDKNASAQKFINAHCGGWPLELSSICRLIGIDNLKTFKKQEFCLGTADTGSNYFTASYFDVSDSISQICGHGFLIREITDFNMLNAAAHNDPLTNARNRRYFDIYCQKLYKNYVTFNSCISLLMLDLDHFKKVNDTYGHNIGDEVLKAFAKVCLDNLRPSDILFRFGGEEFIVIIDGANLEAGKHAADRIRSAMANHPLATSKGLIPVTVSIGGCSSPTNDDLDIAKLVEVADKQLYKAKNGGRNKVEFVDLA